MITFHGGRAAGTYEVVSHGVTEFTIRGWKGSNEPAVFTPTARDALHASCRPPRTANFDTTWFYGSHWVGPGKVELDFAATTICEAPAKHKYNLRG
jgi:hypothetical protein